MAGKLSRWSRIRAFWLRIVSLGEKQASVQNFAAHSSPCLDGSVLSSAMLVTIVGQDPQRVSDGAGAALPQMEHRVDTTFGRNCARAFLNTGVRWRCDKTAISLLASRIPLFAFLINATLYRIAVPIWEAPDGSVGRRPYRATPVVRGRPLPDDLMVCILRGIWLAGHLATDVGLWFKWPGAWRRPGRRAAVAVAGTGFSARRCDLTVLRTSFETDLAALLGQPFLVRGDFLAYGHSCFLFPTLPAIATVVT